MLFRALFRADGERLTYDALGRRIQKGKIAFLYIGDEEIGAFENGVAKELKIPGATAPIAIEINQVPYAPIVDVQGVIRSLIDWQTKKIFKQNDCDVFAAGLSEEIPYAYAGKRYDPNTRLLYFGKRYYDPSLRRWLTHDPIGPEDHSNLYQYVFNNPCLYQDENGEFVFAIPLLCWGAGLAAPTITTYITAAVCGAAVGAIAYGGYKLVETLNNREDLGDYYSGDLSDYWSYSTMKNGSVDPTLPVNPDDLLKKPDWEETTHPDAKEHGHRTFENKETGEKLRHDEGKPGYPGHKGHDHYHRPNPNKTNWKDEYLDGQGNPVPDGHDKSHVYPPDKVWWK